MVRVILVMLVHGGLDNLVPILSGPEDEVGVVGRRANK